MRQPDSRQGADSMKGETPASAQRGDEHGTSREEALVEDAHHDPTAFPALYACAGWFAHPRSKAGGGAWDKSPEHRVSVRCDRAASVEWSWRL